MIKPIIVQINVDLIVYLIFMSYLLNFPPFLLLSVSSARFWPVVCMQGMTTHFKTSKALKVNKNSVMKSVS